ncbi:MAG: carboxylesterase family protein [Rhizobacter sp.]
MSLAAPTTERVVRAEDLFPEVDTAQGRVRGLTSDGVHAFKGLRYGADTGRARRFRAPEPPPTWTGVREATNYGQFSPQGPSSRQRDYADMITYDIQGGGMGEDCLVLNLWTPTLDRNAKKPVIVHLHGGGWYGGSGNSPGCDGAMLAKHGDSIVVTLNHRLGAFGFLDLSAISSEYANSGAMGMLDIVAGLRWLRENVESFGGDPSRVLVFGQSGGGAKTSTLMAMPKAAGLFHRAGVMSGSVLRLATPDHAAEQAERFLKVLGLTRAHLPRLHEMPFQQLLAAQVTLEMGDRAKGEAPRSFAPVVHEHGAIPRHPFDPDAPEVSAQVPMIIGTTLDERSYRTINFDLDDAGVDAFFKKRVGAEADLLLKEYRAEDPAATPYLLQVRLDTDQGFRRAAHVQADRKALADGAPVWTYLWRAPSPAYGGRFGATHGVDVGPSMFDIRRALNGPMESQRRLARVMSSVWSTFAATGNPNNAKLPEWKPYTLPQRATLVIDTERETLVDDPRASLRRYWTERTGS